MIIIFMTALVHSWPNGVHRDPSTCCLMYTQTCPSHHCCDQHPSWESSAGGVRTRPPIHASQWYDTMNSAIKGVMTTYLHLSSWLHGVHCQKKKYIRLHISNLKSIDFMKSQVRLETWTNQKTIPVCVHLFVVRPTPTDSAWTVAWHNIYNTKIWQLCQVGVSVSTYMAVMSDVLGNLIGPLSFECDWSFH